MTALGMTYAGAEGNTEQEMHSVMRLSDDKEVIHEAFLDIMSKLKVCNLNMNLTCKKSIFISVMMIN